MGDEKPPRLRWQTLSGEERYRVIELLRKGEVEVKELCATFGVSRQTLYRAAEAADQASVAALSPKQRGRKREPATRKQLRELTTEKKDLQKQVEQMCQKYEIAQALLDLQRKAERGERLPGEKKNQGTRRRPNPKVAGMAGTKAPMASNDDGGGSGGDARCADGLDQAPGRKRSAR